MVKRYPAALFGGTQISSSSSFSLMHYHSTTSSWMLEAQTLYNYRESEESVNDSGFVYWGDYSFKSRVIRKLLCVDSRVGAFALIYITNLADATGLVPLCILTRRFRKRRYVRHFHCSLKVYRQEFLSIRKMNHCATCLPSPSTQYSTVVHFSKPVDSQTASYLRYVARSNCLAAAET